jgi:hypothetical protein
MSAAVADEAGAFFRVRAESQVVDAMRERFALTGDASLPVDSGDNF